MTAADIADARRRKGEGESIRSLSKCFGVGFRKMQKALAESPAISEPPAIENLEPPAVPYSADYIHRDVMRNGKLFEVAIIGGYSNSLSTIAELKRLWPSLDLDNRLHVVEALNRYHNRKFDDQSEFSQADSPIRWR